MSAFLKIFKPKPGRFGIIPTFVSAALPSITANSTTTTYIPTPRRKCFIERITYHASTIAADADGTVLATVKKWDDSAQAAVSLTAATSLEGLTAKKATEIALLSTLTPAQLTLDEGDALYIEIVHNAAAIDTNHANACIVVELLPSE
jgi:hypothetical protein